MPRLHFGFPGKAPGVGLLLLRIVIAGTIATWASSTQEWHSEHGVHVAVCLLAMILGASLVIGFLTRFAAMMLAFLVASAACFPLIAAAVGVFGSPFQEFDLIMIAIAIGLLGPGAFSLDAVLFGRRKVIIPPTSLSSRP